MAHFYYPDIAPNIFLVGLSKAFTIHKTKRNPVEIVNDHYMTNLRLRMPRKEMQIYQAPSINVHNIDRNYFAKCIVEDDKTRYIMYFDIKANKVGDVPIGTEKPCRIYFDVGMVVHYYESKTLTFYKNDKSAFIINETLNNVGDVQGFDDDGQWGIVFIRNNIIYVHSQRTGTRWQLGSGSGLMGVYKKSICYDSIDGKKSIIYLDIHDAKSRREVDKGEYMYTGPMLHYNDKLRIFTDDVYTLTAEDLGSIDNLSGTIISGSSFIYRTVGKAWEINFKTKKRRLIAGNLPKTKYSQLLLFMGPNMICLLSSDNVLHVILKDKYFVINRKYNTTGNVGVGKVGDYFVIFDKGVDEKYSIIYIYDLTGKLITIQRIPGQPRYYEFVTDHDFLMKYGNDLIWIDTGMY